MRITRNEAAELMNLHPKTIRYWAARGLLRNEGYKDRQAVYDHDRVLEVEKTTRAQRHRRVV